MKAEEAREVADKAKSSELDGVLAEIQVEAKKGNYQVYLYRHLDGITVTNLKRLGYKYTSSFDRNEILVTISW